MLEYLRADVQDVLQDILSTDNCKEYVTDTIPFGLYLVEWADTAKVCVLIYGPDNQYTGLITNDSKAASRSKFGENS